MKPSMALKPLVFAIAAVMAVAVQAGERRHHHDNHHNHHQPRQHQVDVTATAKAYDTQKSTGNYITNEGTRNRATLSDSVQGDSGNVGVNVAAGDGNQQDNAAAIANAGGDNSDRDNSFVFGDATSTARVDQYSNRNHVWNYGSTATADVSGSINGANGNVGVNVAAGDLNQQKNTMAIANSNAPLGDASATASANQNGPGLVVNNNADRTYRVDTLSFTKTFSGDFSRSKSSESHSSSEFTKHFDTEFMKHNEMASASESMKKSSSHASVKAKLDVDVEVDVSSSHRHGYHNDKRSASFDLDVDAKLSASIDKSHKSSKSASSSSSYDQSGSASFDASGSKSRDKSRSFEESSSFDLSNTVSWQVLTPTGWANPVTNTATLSGSVNGGSGNLGVNVAAGVGNQQSNSLAISNTSM